MKNVSIDINMKIKIKYKNSAVIFEIPKYKTWKDIKTKIYRNFYPVNKDILIYFKGKKLTPILNDQIGILFANENFANIYILDNINLKKYNKLKNKNEFKNYILTENSNNSIENKNDIQYKVSNNENIKNDNNEDKLITDNNYIENTNDNNNNNNSGEFMDLNLHENGRKKLPPISNK